MKYIVVSGNPFDGFQYAGPFEDSDEASTFASEMLDEEWWIGTMDGPETLRIDKSYYKGNPTIKDSEYPA